LRARTLKALAAIGDAKTDEAVEIALKSKNELVRKEAQRIKAQLKPNEGAAVLAEILNKKESTLLEKQGALQTLAGLKDANADTLSGEWLKKLNAGQAAEEMHLDVLEAAAGRSALKEEIAKYQASLKADDTIKDYRDTLKGGDAAAGKKVFFEKTEAQCMRCHRVGSEGGDAGPALGDIGKRTSREYILESMVAPNHKIAAGFETLIIKLTDGKTHVGIKKGESETEIELLCPPDLRVKLAKAKIASTKTGPSSMPEDLVKLLTKRDVRNLVEFMAQQK
jgi:quinoprotein glucose dehydrogenase